LCFSVKVKGIRSPLRLGPNGGAEPIRAEGVPSDAVAIVEPGLLAPKGEAQ